MGVVRPPSEGLVPKPKPRETIVFRDFFTVGLRFPCDKNLSLILDRFRVKLHQLTRNAFIQVSKFFWVARTFDGVVHVDGFTRFQELHPQKKRVRFDEDQKFFRTSSAYVPLPTGGKMKVRKLRGLSSRRLRKTSGKMNGFPNGFTSRLICLRLLASSHSIPSIARWVLYPSLLFLLLSG